MLRRILAFTMSAMLCASITGCEEEDLATRYDREFLESAETAKIEKWGSFMVDNHAALKALEAHLTGLPNASELTDDIQLVTSWRQSFDGMQALLDAGDTDAADAEFRARMMEHAEIHVAARKRVKKLEQDVRAALKPYYEVGRPKDEADQIIVLREIGTTLDQDGLDPIFRSYLTAPANRNASNDVEKTLDQLRKPDLSNHYLAMMAQIEIATQPHVHRARLHYGTVLARNGDHAQAIKILQPSIDALINDPSQDKGAIKHEIRHLVVSMVAEGQIADGTPYGVALLASAQEALEPFVRSVEQAEGDMIRLGQIALADLTINEADQLVKFGLKASAVGLVKDMQARSGEPGNRGYTDMAKWLEKHGG